MERKKIAGIVLFVTGAIILVLSLIADLIGIGVNPIVFGYRQIIGTIVGVIVIVAGLILILRE